jgi:hypothetical protein
LESGSFNHHVYELKALQLNDTNGRSHDRVRVAASPQEYVVTLLKKGRPLQSNCNFRFTFGSQIPFGSLTFHKVKPLNKNEVSFDFIRSYRSKSQFKSARTSGSFAEKYGMQSMTRVVSQNSFSRETNFLYWSRNYIILHDTLVIRVCPSNHGSPPKWPCICPIHSVPTSVQCRNSLVGILLSLEPTISNISSLVNIWSL